MGKIILSSIILSLVIFSSCSVDPGKNVRSVPNLISEKFLNDTEYEIICLGFPKQGLSGVQKEESAKRAALLNAYFYSKNRFDETVNPDLDGRTVKLAMFDDHAELTYVIKKINLKKRLKK